MPTTAATFEIDSLKRRIARLEMLAAARGTINAHQAAFIDGLRAELAILEGEAA